MFFCHNIGSILRIQLRLSGGWDGIGGFKKIKWNFPGTEKNIKVAGGREIRAASREGQGHQSLKFSTRTLYGLKAILVLAARYGEGSLSVSQIAKKESISMPYLEQILNALKKQGMVKSVRGPQGGYVLARKPADVTLEELFHSLESTKKGPSDRISPDMDEISIGNAIFWQKFSVSIQNGLSKITLKDLVDEARRVKKTKPRAQTPTFHI